MQREKCMFRKVILPIISMVAVFSSAVYAVGLGEIKQSSGLNQPLKAHIPLLSAGDLAEYELQASLASNKEFDKVGVDKVFFLNNIKFKTLRSDNGQILIDLSTRTPVKEPFLNFIVELNWPNGRILREYTLLLDPPVFDNTTSSSVSTPTSEPPPQTYRETSVNDTEASTPFPLTESRENSQTNFDGNTYQVSESDTLWSIASRVRPDRSVSIHQTLVAIYRHNPHAFSKGNINNLLKGKVLDIPDADSIANVPQRAALQDMVTQNRQWRSGGGRKIIDRSGETTSSTETTNDSSRLSLSTESSGTGDAQGYGSDTGELTELKEQLARTQEESATLQAENEALRQRLAEILDKVEQTQESSAIQVEDVELAALSSGSETETSNEELSEPTSSLEENVTEELENQVSEQTNDVSSEEIVAENQANNAADSLADKETPPPSIFKKEDKGFIDSILDGGLLLWGSIGGILLILFLVFFWRMKKRMENEDFQDDLVASAGAGSMDTTETFELPDVGDDMLVELDMDEEEFDVSEESDESFDPIGEADIYIAYGKHEQAESLLLDAIEDNSVRSDLKVKLMECYVEMDNKAKFEELEAQVKEGIDYEDWQQQIIDLKAKAWPDDYDQIDLGDEQEDDDFDLPSTEDIFGDSDDELDIDFDEELSDMDGMADDISGLDGEVESGPDGDNSDSDSLDIDSSINEDELEDIDMDDLDMDIDDIDMDDIDMDDIDMDDVDMDDVDMDDSDIDELDLDNLDKDDDSFDIGEDIQESEDSGSENESHQIDKIDEEQVYDSPELSQEENDALLGEGLDDIDMEDEEFQLDTDILNDEDNLTESDKDTDELTMDFDSDLVFDSDESEDSDFEDSLVDDEDEMATKLDLARAYVDMGDSEGAQEILREVIADGTEQQQSEAQSLLDKSE